MFTLVHKMGLRKNKNLLEVAKSLMFIMNLPKPYWKDVVLSVIYLINRMPLKALDYKGLLEVFQGKTSYTVPPKIFYCVLCMRRMLVNWNQKHLNMCLLDIL